MLHTFNIEIEEIYVCFVLLFLTNYNDRFIVVATFCPQWRNDINCTSERWLCLQPWFKNYYHLARTISFHAQKPTRVQFNILRMAWPATLTFVAVNSHYVRTFDLYYITYTCDKTKKSAVCYGDVNDKVIFSPGDDNIQFVKLIKWVFDFCVSDLKIFVIS